MRIAEITERTVSVEMEPGERFKVDRYGFGYSTFTLRFNKHIEFKTNLINLLKECAKLKLIIEESSDKDELLEATNKLEFLLEKKDTMIKEMFCKLPLYRYKRVYVGHNH